MKTVLFTTDISGLKLNPRPDLIVIPTNRYKTDKVHILKEACDIRQIPRIWHDDNEQLFEDLKDMDLELGLSWLYSRILPINIIDLFTPWILNYHGDNNIAMNMPYRDRTLRASVESGIKRIKMIWHVMTEEVDAGEVIAEKWIDVTTFEETRLKMIDIGVELYQGFILDGKVWG